MVVASHLFMLVGLLLLPTLLGRWLCRRWDRPSALLTAGVLAFVFAELARLAVSSGSDALFRQGVFPLPSSEHAVMARSIVVGALTALAFETVRLVLVSNQFGDSDDSFELDLRGLTLWGIGFGIASAALSGVLELGLALVSMWGEGMTFAEIEAFGVSEHTAQRIGLKIFDWWERKPSMPLLFGAGELALAAIYAGLTAVVGRAVRFPFAKRVGLWLVAVLFHGTTVTVAMHHPRWAIYGASALALSLVAGLLWRSSSQSAKDASSAL